MHSECLRTLDLCPESRNAGEKLETCTSLAVCASSANVLFSRPEPGTFSLVHQQVRWQCKFAFAGFYPRTEKVIPTNLKDSGDRGRFPRPLVMPTCHEFV